ncbi:MAG: PIG-L deacetylase family protein [Pseudohongiellaceae bacterium]
MSSSHIVFQNCPKGSWIIFAPHADDETFGMGGTLLKAKQQGIETHLVVFTDGAQGGEAADLVAIRRGEVERASRQLGFSSLQCWTEPDRGLLPRKGVIAKTTDIICDIKPATVFFPGALEIHPDHRASALIVWKALQQARSKGITPEPISYEIGVQNPINLLIDTTKQCSEKKMVMQLYDSQNNENNYPELVLALDKGRTFSLPLEVRYAEGFFRFKLSDIDRSLESVIRSIIELYLELD